MSTQLTYAAIRALSVLDPIEVVPQLVCQDISHYHTLLYEVVINVND